MMEHFDFALVDWSRAQFALTAMFHWIFVPLTLGITFIIAIMETIYVRTGDPEWKRITQFWMKLFGINFAVGVATGIILEFEFGTNWSNYSWFVGDIFGAPLAVEGIMAFFLESTFIAVMFFGWNKVSKRFHLTATWLTAIGANLSALWILVANGWMQNPVGMRFNPDTARNEMVDFWAVLFSPTAINKFLHTVSSGYLLAAIFVIGISSWFLLKRREMLFAKRSIIVASVFGLVMTLFTIVTGDESAREIARTQPMKFASMEGMYIGSDNAPLVAVGILQDSDIPHQPSMKDFVFSIEIPNMLSYMAYLKPGIFIPGIRDLVHGNEEEGILSYFEKIKRGRVAIQTLREYKDAQNSGDETLAASLALKFQDPVFLEEYFRYFGYGYYYDEDQDVLARNAHMLIPHVPVSFYSFHLMVILGGHFLALIIVFMILAIKNRLEGKKWLFWTAILSIPLAYLASQAGWILAEMGRQPWVIQDVMPTLAAVTRIETSSVQLTFWLFAVTFTVLLVAEIRIMATQIKKGPKEGGNKDV
ncbi:MAG: cytochrome ubiquinol oxidase subunit I [Bacteroidales bacterium]|nr:cytochrome ubiquinol oxidase subunit I [Bacteroidales bacterium]